DPKEGRRRRAVCTDQFRKLWHDTRDAAGVIGRDLGHRAQGLAAGARHLVTPHHADDRVVAERGRAAPGPSGAHPRGGEVAARDARVTLHGPILADEVADLLAGVAGVRGVKGVENQLEAHQPADNHPALRGGRERLGPTFDVMQSRLSPATRFLLGAAAGGLAGWGLTQRAPSACVLGTVGLALAWPGATGAGAGRGFGLPGGRRGVRVQKTTTINGPVERVFPFFTRYDNWPRFMSNLREVRDRGNGRSHWVARGPAGVPVS